MDNHGDTQRQKRLAAKKQWLKDNPEKARASCKRWRAKNPGRQAALSYAWRQKNPNKATEAVNRWRSNHREQVRFHEKRKRAMRRNAQGAHSWDEWQAQVDYFGNRCAYCLRRLTAKSTQRDHIVAITQGGSNYIENIIPACGPCNNRKHARSLLQFVRACY